MNKHAFETYLNETYLNETYLNETYLNETNKLNSGKAASYIRALNLLSEMIAVSSKGFEDCINIWCMDSVERLEGLYHITNNQKQYDVSNPWHDPQFPKSYLQNGFCTTAIRAYQDFLIEHNHQKGTNESL